MGHEGMTLLEVIGAVAILGILAAIVVQSATQQVRQAAREEEQRRLKQMARALEKATSRARQLPGVADLGGWMATELGWLTNDVLANRRGNARAFVVDPRLRLGPAPGSSTLPFVQSGIGSVEPVAARVLVLSSMSSPLPSNTLSAEDFDVVWSGQPGTVPSAWGWAGPSDDFLVQRIDMAPWFVPMVLMNPSLGEARFGTDVGPTNALTVAVQVAWYLKGTVLRLHGADGWLQARQVVQDAEAFSFDNGAWRGRMFTTIGRREVFGLDMDFAAERFLASASNPDATPQGNPTTPPTVLAAFRDYMEAYLSWEGAAFSTNATSPTSVFSVLQTRQSELETRLIGLINKP